MRKKSIFSFERFRRFSFVLSLHAPTSSNIASLADAPTPLLAFAMKLLVLALSLASARGFGYFPDAPAPTPPCTSAGACYDSYTHIVTCDVPEDDCTGTYHWLEPGAMSSWTGCCHCACSCDHALETNTDVCIYND